MVVTWRKTTARTLAFVITSKLKEAKGGQIFGSPFFQLNAECSYPLHTDERKPIRAKNKLEW